KRIGRAKNLENLAREIKIGGELIDKLETELTDGAQQVAAWKESSQKELLGELDTQRNRVAQELISIRTKYEQHQSFIENSQNRKQDIEDKVAAIERELRDAQPQLDGLRIRKTALESDVSDLNERYL